ncbi:MAG: indole-3-glycerol phosphate synthase TrpC [Candidatus Dormiibacterota bacterium]
MSQVSSDLLRRLVEEAVAETDRRRACTSEAELASRLADAPPVRPFAGALRRDRLALIAEMKRRTPTMGVLSTDYDPAQRARLYSAAGADAISVLCQQTSFGGEPEHVALARSGGTLPVMRKDFVVTEHQLLEARVLGADAVLLIAGALTPARLGELLRQTRALGMDALVEVHDEAEVETALGTGATLLGINHRDLVTFDVDLGLTERLRPRIPGDRLVVSESGVRGPEDARRLRAAGADAILVGEALMRADDPGAAVRALTGAGPERDA